MTEEEKREFEEFLQWKAEKKKKEEETKALEEAKQEQQSEEEEKKQGSPEEQQDSSNDAPTTDSYHSPIEDSDTDSEDIYDEGVSYEFEKKVGFGICVFILIVFGLGFLVNGYSNKQRDEATAQQLADKKQQDSIAKIEAAEYAKEKHRQDSIKRVARIDLLRHTIHINKARISSPNSAGGVDAYFNYKNVSNKTIKYLYWSGYPINRVGDPVECEIRGRSEARGKDTGPIKPGRSSDGYWDCMWYNYSAKKLVLTGVDIEYMDGSTIHISQNELKYVR